MARGGTKKKYHLVKWEIICKSKKKGGIGIKNLKWLNISLLCKWWWKLEKEDGLWQQIVKFKYMRNSSILEVKHKVSDSPMWSDVLKIKDIYLQGWGISFKNGGLTRFWQDPWIYEEPLSSHTPLLYEICENKNITVACALKGDPIRFRRWLHTEIRNEWEKFWKDASKFQLEEHENIVIWNLGKNNKFTVKSVYNGLTKNDCGFYHKRIWRGKIRAKIKIFLWLLSCNALLTKDNLRNKKTGWVILVVPFVIVLNLFLTCFFSVL